MSKPENEAFAQREPLIPMLQRRVIVGGMAIIAFGGIMYQATEPQPKPRAAIAHEVLCLDTALQPDITGHGYDEQLAAMVDALGKQESGNDWTAIQAGGKDLATLGTGAYQYNASAWRNIGGHQFAYLASPGMQYRKAKQDMSANYAQLGNWNQIAYLHAGSFDPSSCQQRDYVRQKGDALISLMNRNLHDPNQITTVPGLPLQEYNPQLADK